MSLEKLTCSRNLRFFSSSLIFSHKLGILPSKAWVRVWRENEVLLPSIKLSMIFLRLNFSRKVDLRKFSLLKNSVLINSPKFLAISSLLLGIIAVKLWRVSFFEVDIFYLPLLTQGNCFCYFLCIRLRISTNSKLYIFLIFNKKTKKLWLVNISKKHPLLFSIPNIFSHLNFNNLSILFAQDFSLYKQRSLSLWSSFWEYSLAPKILICSRQLSMTFIFLAYQISFKAHLLYLIFSSPSSSF